MPTPDHRAEGVVSSRLASVTDLHVEMGRGGHSARQARSAHREGSEDETAGALATFALLLDGRTPTGAYAHSGGAEAAVGEGRVHDLASLARFLEGRLDTTARCDGALALATARQMAPLGELSAECASRIASPALRRASRAEGRGMLRLARSIWPSPYLEELRDAPGGGPYLPIAIGRSVLAARLDPQHAGLLSVHGAIAGPAWATVRLLGLDPYLVAGLLAKLAPAMGRVALEARRAVEGATSLAELPASSSILLELAAERRENWEVRLFVS